MILLKPLLYFSLFKYPLTEEEIYSFSEFNNASEVKSILDSLVKSSVIFKIGEFYLCEDNPELVKRRIAGNDGAKLIFKKAQRVSKLISKFPFVEGVGISGSLSKGYFDENGDIDFFIITAPKRLWLARTLLILYKKIFLFNSKKYFCVNYFISTNSLELGEKNRFTATELVTMIPMYGDGSFKEFYERNAWAYSMMPNKQLENARGHLKPLKKSFLVSTFQAIIDNKLGDFVEGWLLKLTYKKWRGKFTNMDKSNFHVAMKSTKNVSKHHPQNFQKQVIDRLNEKYDEYRQKHNIIIPKEHA